MPLLCFCLYTPRDRQLTTSKAARSLLGGSLRKVCGLGRGRRGLAVGTLGN